MNTIFETINCPHCDKEIPKSCLDPNPQIIELENELAALKGERDSIKQTRDVELDAARREGESAGFEKFKEKLKSYEEGNSESQAEIISLRSENLQLKGEKNNIKHNVELAMKLEFDRKLNEQRKSDLAQFDAKVEESAQQSMVASRLELEEERKEKERMRKQIEKLDHGTKNSSQEIQGEAGEVFAEDIIRQSFPMDIVTEVKKGQRGADIIHTVTNMSRSVGSILIESKNTKNFQPAWIDKLETNMQEKNVTMGVLVTLTLPEDPFAYIDRGIYVVSFSTFQTILPVLRMSLIKLFNFERKEDNKNEKAVRVYEFFKSEAFALQLKKLIKLHTAREELLEKEKAYIQKIWGKRRAQLDWEVSVVMGFIAEIEREALPGEFSLVDQEMAVLEPDFGDELIEDLD